MAGGRPTKYTPELLAKAHSYLDGFGDSGDEVIPSIAGLSLALGISRETCHDWAGQKSKREFSDIVKQISLKQESVLVNKGLAGKFNPLITKLILGKHGYHEKQQQELSGPGGGPIENKWVIEVRKAD